MLIILDVGKSGIMAPADSMSGERAPWFINGHPLTASSYDRRVRDPFYKGTNPIYEESTLMKSRCDRERTHRERYPEFAKSTARRLGVRLTQSALHPAVVCSCALSDHV